MRGATEGVRGRSSALSVAEKATSGWRCREAVPGPIAVRQTTVIESAEAGGAPSSALPAGVGSSQGGPAPQGRTRSRSGEPLCGQGRRASARGTPGNRTIHGCSCRKSIAEVGKKHLLREGRGEPRGEPSRHGVAWCGDSSRRDGLERSRQKGARSSVRTSQGARGFARPRGRDRTDGRHPGLRATSSLTGRRRTESWRRGVSVSADERQGARRRTRDRRSRASTYGATQDVRGGDVG